MDLIFYLHRGAAHLTSMTQLTPQRKQGRGRNRARIATNAECLRHRLPTPDRTCIRDYIHVSDLIAVHCDALAYLRAGGASTTLNCCYGHGFSVLEVIESVKRVSGVDFKVEFTGR